MSIVARNNQTLKFVDRKEELSQLEKHFHRATQGSGTTIFLKGEAGVGKTALFNHFVENTVRTDAKIMRGRCLYQDDTEPYLPFIEALKPKKRRSVMKRTVPLGLIGLGVDEEEKEEEQEIPLGLFHKAEVESGVMEKKDVDKERDRMFSMILDTIEKLSKSLPLILFIDDIQWADKASLQLLHYVSRHIGNMKVLLICAYRPEEVGIGHEQEDALTEIFRRMSEENLSEDVEVGRMSRESIAKIVDAMINSDVPESFMDRMYRESEGNPFFVIEVIKSLCEDGTIDCDSVVWAPKKDIDSLGLPSSVRDVVTRRIARLDYKTKKILMYAGVIGYKFQFKVLQKAMDIDEEDLLDKMDQLIELHLIIEEPSELEETFRFDHVQIRQVISEGLSRSRARVMHKKVGELIEDIYEDDLSENIYNLSRHFFIGQVWDKGYKYSVKAGEQATNMLALDDAEKYYRQALRCLDRIRPSQFPGGKEKLEREKSELMMRVGEIVYSSGRFSDAIENFSLVFNFAKRHDDEALKADALCHIGLSKTQKGDFTDAEKDLDAALEIYEELQNHNGAAKANRGLGYVHWRAGELDEAIEHYNETVENAMRVGDERLKGTTYIDIGNVYNHRGDFVNGLKFYNMAIESLEKVEDISELARAYNNIGDVYMQMEEWDTAIEYFENSANAAKKINNVYLRYFAWNNAAQAMAHKGELDRAEEFAKRALELSESRDDKITMSGVFMTLGIIYRKRKEWSKSIENLNKSILIMEMMDIPFDLAQSQIQLGLTYRAMGEIEEAVEILKSTKEILLELGAKKELASVESYLNELAEK